MGIFHKNIQTPLCVHQEIYNEVKKLIWGEYTMIIDYKGNKSFRILNIYERLNKGELLNKTTLVNDFGVGEKTIQRDIDDLRAYLAEQHQFENEISIKYDRKKNGYYLVRFEREWLTNQEVLAMCKILLESRAFRQDELDILLDKLLMQVVPSDKKVVQSIIANEKLHYVPLKHNKKIMEQMWELSQAIIQNRITEIAYERKDGTNRVHKIKPVSIMFSEYYFYLIAFMADESKTLPTVFRIDRIKKCEKTDETFKLFSNRFEEGEFRKRVQFMYCGELHRVTFKYKGENIDSVLDRLPTARIIEQKDNVYTITVDVFGDGIYMWLRSQGDRVELVNKM